MTKKFSLSLLAITAAALSKCIGTAVSWDGTNKSKDGLRRRASEHKIESSGHNRQIRKRRLRNTKNNILINRKDEDDNDSHTVDVKFNSHGKQTTADTERVIVKYQTKEAYSKIKKVAKVVYHDFEKYKILSVELDSTAQAILGTSEGIKSIEPDTIWRQQGHKEGVVTREEIKEFVEVNPKLVRTRKNAIRKNSERNLQPDLNYSEQVPYGITMTQADQISYGYSGTASVCIVDTGALKMHPDFDLSLLDGIDRRTQTTQQILEWSNDVRGHGTHVAGTVSARSGNNYGVVGMGRIPTFITRGLDDNGAARETDIIEALEQCEAAGSKVISLSLSGPSISDTFKEVIDRLYEENILVVAASGNEGRRVQTYPSSYPKVISVGALTEDEVLWEDSNYGPWIELTAPGHMILSLGLYSDGQYQFALYSGTSMATPHVASSVALLWSHHPDCTATQIRYALAYTAKDLGTEGCDEYYGYGLIQVRSALEFLDINSCSGAYWGQNMGNGQCSAVDVPASSLYLVEP